ncbi:hypothetical protein DRH14_00805 [Candidatus Shapirobacteria bacterium]|nr:MAG: hypothetical protein DRH14_00805 [Candidatus Shapirobacteria bacterium]
MVKINLASGPSGLDNWINYDWGLLAFLSKFPFLTKIIVKLKLLDSGYLQKWPPIKLWNLKWPLPLKNRTVDFIYCSHFLEHLDYWQSIRILQQSHRLLKKGGIIRLVLPDIDKIIKNYQLTRNIHLLDRRIFGFDQKKLKINFVDQIKKKFIRPHQQLFNPTKIKKMLKITGFSNIRQLDYRQGQCPDLNKLDIAVHRHHSLYFEAST